MSKISFKLGVGAASEEFELNSNKQNKNNEQEIFFDLQMRLSIFTGVVGAIVFTLLYQLVY